MRRFLLGLAGVLLLLCSLAHAFGWGQFTESLSSAPEEAVRGLFIGWIWGSTAFLGFGAIVLGSLWGWARTGADPRPTAGPVALALLLFGLWAMFQSGFSPHFLLFLALGLLVGAPLIGGIDSDAEKP